MKLQEIANLVIVRNHIEHLINTDRQLVPKDRLREISDVKREMDRTIIEAAMNVYLEEDDNSLDTSINDIEQAASLAEALAAGNTLEGQDITITKGNAKTVVPEEKPEEKVEAKPKKAKAKKADAALDDEIRQRIAAAKAEVADKKGEAKPSFQRSDS